MTASELPASCVATASDIVSVQAGCTVDEALVKMDQRARMISQTLEEVAEQVVHGRTRFDQ